MEYWHFDLLHRRCNCIATHTKVCKVDGRYHWRVSGGGKWAEVFSGRCGPALRDRGGGEKDDFLPLFGDFQ